MIASKSAGLFTNKVPVIKIVLKNLFSDNINLRARELPNNE